MTFKHIKSAKPLVDEAVQQIIGYQSGEDFPIKFRFDHLNQNLLGGLFKQSILTIAGISSGGKSFLLQQLEEDIFDKNLNPHCDEYVLLRNNMEMTVFKLMLRELKNKTNRSIKNILFNKNSKEQDAEFKEVLEVQRSKNIFYMEDALDPDEWFNSVSEFCEFHADKRQIIVTIDHMALIKDSFGGKKSAMDKLGENINILKKKYKNVCFIILSQLNRDIEGRTEPKLTAPRRSDIFNTDTLFQLSDLVIVIHSPYRLGIEKYMVVSARRYPHLVDFMWDSDKKSTNFFTKNNIFWHYLKIRERDDDVVSDLYVTHFYQNEEDRKSSGITRYKPTLFDTDSSDDYELPRMEPSDGVFDNSSEDEDDDNPFI